MKSVVWTRHATDDLRAIEERYEALAPALGREIVGRIVRATDPLIDFPGLGARVGYRDWRRWRGGDTPYQLIYRASRDGITIVRVRHDRQGWPEAKP